MCNTVTLSRQELLDSRADLRRDLQFAQRMDAFDAMRSAVRDICEIDQMLREDKCITYSKLN